jgi:cardiolipin synthase
MKTTKKEIFSIPNLLSYLRILLIPAFVLIYITAEDVSNYYLAALIIFLSALTDMADGFIARKYGMITELGKALDPIADKLTQIAVILCLLTRYQGMWVLVLLFTIKELFMGINGLILLRKGKKLNGAKWFGKVSTAVFFICTIVLIALPELPGMAVYILINVTILFLLLSFVLYIPAFAKLYRSK